MVGLCKYVYAVVVTVDTVFRNLVVECRDPYSKLPINAGPKREMDEPAMLYLAQFTGLLLSFSCRQDSYFSQFRLVNPKLKPNLVQLMHSLHSLLSSITLSLKTPILYSYSYSDSSHSLLSSITLFSAHTYKSLHEEESW